jgi:2-iminobutanoate/2-iminopropanoate deaminase
VAALKQFKGLLAETFLGELRRVKLTLHFPHWPRAWQNYQKTDWINTRLQGGPLREIASHFIYATLELFGGSNAAKRVNAQVLYPRTSPAPGLGVHEAPEISTLGIIELHNGVSVQVDLLSEIPALAEDIQLTAYGTEGTISLVNFQTLMVSKDQEPLRLYDKDKPVPANQLMSSAFVVDEMARAIIHHRHAPQQWNLVSIYRGKQTQKILNALYRSEGRWLDLDHSDHHRAIHHLTAEGVTKPLPIFSHTTTFQGLIHVSCMQGFIPETFDFPSDDAGEQAEQVIKNLRTVLEQSNSSLERVLKLTLYFVALEEDFPKVNEVINRYFPTKPPARSSLGIAALPRKARIVMDCTAATQ